MFNVRLLIAGALLAPLSLAEPVRGETGLAGPGLPAPAPGASCQLNEVLTVPEVEANSLAPAPQGRDCFELTQGRDLEDRATEVLLEALEIAESIAEPAKKVRFLSNIAVKYANLGLESEANAILLQAIEVAEAIETLGDRGSVLAAIAMSAAKSGQPSRAMDILSGAIDTANAIEDPQAKEILLAEIALGYAELEEYAISSDLLAEARVLASAPPPPPPPPEEPIFFPLEPTPWTGSVALYGQLFSGRKSAGFATLATALARQWSTNEIDIGAFVTNSFDNSRVAPEDENQLIGQFDANYRHHISERWLYFVNSHARRDEVEGINIRTSLYTGPGLTLWRKGPERSLNMELGFGIRYEETIDDSDFEFTVAHYKLNYQNILFENLRFGQLLAFTIPIEDSDDYFAESITTIGVPLSERWSFNNGLSFRYDARPVSGNPNLQVTVDTGIKYEF
ncbi:MAG: DUF481 domain-containing protein [Oscillatoria sp. SIO1A7]|nr:DUF481 domain-containing protein [Oscillatoria sp. SIO1A7]